MMTSRAVLAAISERHGLKNHDYKMRIGIISTLARNSKKTVRSTCKGLTKSPAISKKATCTLFPLLLTSTARASTRHNPQVHPNSRKLPTHNSHALKVSRTRSLTPQKAHSFPQILCDKTTCTWQMRSTHLYLTTNTGSRRKRFRGWERSVSRRGLREETMCWVEDGGDEV